MPETNKTHKSNSPEETAKIAALLAGKIEQGAIILLQGNLGAGKTLFASSLINALSKTPQKVTSPTFNIVQTYETESKGQIWHFDLYRLKHADELYEVGIEEAFGNHICLIEWPEIAESFFEGLDNIIKVKIEKLEEGKREISIDTPSVS